MNSDDGGFPRTIRPSLIQFIHHPAAAIHSTFPSTFPNLSVNVLTAALAVLSISKPIWIMYVHSNDNQYQLFCPVVVTVDVSGGSLLIEGDRSERQECKRARRQSESGAAASGGRTHERTEKSNTTSSADWVSLINLRSTITFWGSPVVVTCTLHTSHSKHLKVENDVK